MRQDFDNGAQTLNLASRSAGQPLNGIGRLSTPTINGSQGTRLMRYKFGDAHAGGCSSWGTGPTLDIAGGGGLSMLYNRGAPFLGALDDAVTFQGTGQSGNSIETLGSTEMVNVRAMDFWLHVILQAPKAAPGSIGVAVRSLDYSPLVGWQLMIGSNLQPYFYLMNTSNVSATSATGMSPHAWYSIDVFCNRDEASTNGLVVYLNGLAGTGVDPTTYNVDLNPAGDYTEIGGQYADGKYGHGGSIAYVELRAKTDWFQAGAAGPAEWAALSLARSKTLFHGDVFAGGSDTVTCTRSSKAFSDRTVADGSRRWFLCAGGVPRVVERTDDDGDTIQGILIEPAATTTTVRSEIQGYWQPANHTVADGGVSPVDGHNWCDVTESAVTSQHTLGYDTDGVGGSPSFTIGAGKYATALAIVKFGANGADRLNFGFYHGNGSGTFGGIVVDKATGAFVRSVEAAATAYPQYYWHEIVSCGNGVYLLRVVVKNEDASTQTWYGPTFWGEDPADPHDGTGGSSYLGDAGGVSFSVCYGAGFCNMNAPYYDSIIIAEGGATTRNGDVISMAAAGNAYGPAGTMEFDYLPNGGATGVSQLLLGLDLGAAWDEDINMALGGSGQQVWTSNDSDYAQINDGASDPFDGKIHSAKVAWDASRVEQWMDGATEGTPLTGEPVPVDGVDTIRIGSTSAGTYQLGGVLSKIRIHNRPKF